MIDITNFVTVAGLVLVCLTQGVVAFTPQISTVSHRVAPRVTPLMAEEGGKGMIGGILDIKATLLDRIKPILPILGFYAVMNAPIYGIGALGSTGSNLLGSMTDFSTVVNRGGPTQMISNEYIVAPSGVAPKARVVKAPQ